MINFLNWSLLKDFNEQKSFTQVKEELLVESTTASRYSVEVNYRTGIDEAMEAYAKIALGYVGQALKQDGRHIKHVYDQKPIRIIASSRNWDDGEWVGLVHFHPEHDGGSFIISKGFYEKDTRNVAIQSSKKCDGDSPAAIVTEFRNMMWSLKGQPDRFSEKLKGAPLKRGPK